MKKGEKALLTIKPEYGYGEQGSPPTIPANATLQFEVELLSWNSVNDITPSKDGGIIKTVVTEGEGWAMPKDDDEVTGIACTSNDSCHHHTEFIKAGRTAVSSTMEL